MDEVKGGGLDLVERSSDEATMHGWTKRLAECDEDAWTAVGGEARELGRGLLRLVAERRARTGEDAFQLLTQALAVLECASWYLVDALEAVEDGEELAELRGHA